MSPTPSFPHLTIELATKRHNQKRLGAGTRTVTLESLGSGVATEQLAGRTRANASR